MTKTIKLAAAVLAALALASACGGAEGNEATPTTEDVLDSIQVSHDCGWLDLYTDDGGEIAQAAEDRMEMIACGRQTDVTTAAEPQYTRSEENAIGSAESYLSFMAFSRSGLIEQLEYEGFTTAEAKLAVDSLNVDWNEQAWKSAENYLDTMSFSRSGLIDQLIYEGFTPAQATYGVDKTGL